MISLAYIPAPIPDSALSRPPMGSHSGRTGNCSCISSTSAIYGGRQCGAAALMTVLFMFIVVALAVLVSLGMSGSDMSDSTSQHSSVQALYLAESGLERAAQRYSAGIACGAALMEGPIVLGSGEFEIVAPVPLVVSGLCRVRVTGRSGSVTRTIEGDISTSFVEHFPSSADFTANWTVSQAVSTGCTGSGGYSTFPYANAPGSIGGYVIAASCLTTDNDRFRYRIERPLGGASFVAMAGTPINASFYWRKASNDTTGGRPHLLELNILATTGQSQTLWSDNNRLNMANWQFQSVSVLPTTGGGGTAGRTMDRVELYFDLRENNSGGNRYVAGAFDYIQLGGGSTGVRNWREVIQ